MKIIYGAIQFTFVAAQTLGEYRSLPSKKVESKEQIYVSNNS